MTEDSSNTVQNWVKDIASNLHSQFSTFKNVSGYISTTGGASGELQSNPNTAEDRGPTTIVTINGRNHLTEKRWGKYDRK